MAEFEPNADLLKIVASQQGYKGDGVAERFSAEMSHRKNPNATTLYAGETRRFILNPSSGPENGHAPITEKTLEDAKRGTVTLLSSEVFSNGWGLAAPTLAEVVLLETSDDLAYFARVGSLGEVSRGVRPEDALRGIGDGMVSRLQELQARNGNLGRARPVLEAFEAALVPPPAPQA